jgi:hypothetical protein
VGIAKSSLHINTAEFHRALLVIGSLLEDTISPCPAEEPVWLWGLARLRYSVSTLPTRWEFGVHAGPPRLADGAHEALEEIEKVEGDAL